MWRVGIVQKLWSSVTWPGLPRAQAAELSNVALNSPSICCGLRWPSDKWKNVSYFLTPIHCFCNLYIYFLCWLQRRVFAAIILCDQGPVTGGPDELRWSREQGAHSEDEARPGWAEHSFVPAVVDNLASSYRAIMDAIAVSEPLHQNFLLINCKRERKNTLTGIHPCQQKFLI